MTTASPTEPVDIIVPVLNEEEILQEFHTRIRRLNFPVNLVFVDNASTDKSVDIISSFPDTTLIRHQSNEGYGASLIDGIKASNNSKIVIIDADCEYPPEAIPALVKELDNADVVYTSRFLDNSNTSMPFLKRKGNQIISSLFNLLFKQNVTDLYTGCKAINRSALQGIKLERKGFEHVLELGVKLARNNIKITEIPVVFSPRHTGQAKMKHVSETLKYLYLTFSYYLRVR